MYRHCVQHVGMRDTHPDKFVCYAESLWVVLSLSHLTFGVEVSYANLKSLAQNGLFQQICGAINYPFQIM